jgi:hypothetical protein
MTFEYWRQQDHLDRRGETSFFIKVVQTTDGYLASVENGGSTLKVMCGAGDTVKSAIGDLMLNNINQEWLINLLGGIDIKTENPQVPFLERRETLRQGFREERAKRNTPKKSEKFDFTPSIDRKPEYI